MFYNICTLIVFISIGIYLKLEKQENKIVFSAIFPLLLSMLIFVETDLLTASLVFIINMISNLMLMKFITNHEDELNTKRYYMPYKKIGLTIICILIIIVAFEKYEETSYIIKKEVKISEDIFVILSLIFFSMINMKKWVKK